MRLYPAFVFILIGLLCLLGCSPQEEQKAEQKVEEEVAHEQQMNEKAIKLWNDKVSWVETWSLFPETVEFQESTGNPHSQFGSVYVNELALKAVNDGATTMPDGAILVRKNYNENRELLKIMVMQKEANDWFWSVYTDDGSVEIAGNLQKCSECHIDAGTDMIYSWETE